jgi:hypothetical protein
VISAKDTLAIPMRSSTPSPAACPPLAIPVIGASSSIKTIYRS